MPRRVLVPYDGASQSAGALEYAIAAFPGASITALYVVDLLGDPDVDVSAVDEHREEYEAHGEAVLDGATDLAADAGSAIGTELRFGVPHRDILEFVTRHDVDHVVLGSHGRTEFVHPFLGQVSEAVVRRSPASTTVVPVDRAELAGTDVTGGSILVPVDGSEQSTAALEYAAAQFPAASLTALHVVGLPFEYSAEELDESPFEPLLSVLKSRGREVLDATLDAADVGEAAVDGQLTYGKPPQSIVDYALDYQFDQVVMGIHGRSRSARLLTGSVAETVARRAAFPVTLVRGHPAEDGA